MLTLWLIIIIIWLIGIIVIYMHSEAIPWDSNHALVMMFYGMYGMYEMILMIVWTFGLIIAGLIIGYWV